ncbi:unnamed protein product [Ilex paraguariensis]|uniref:Uncharacterized protein n=1 Tax=Ilex paraguariensis TaxID=185542 RepID=A0ABC8RB84_9AQUA
MACEMAHQPPELSHSHRGKVVLANMVPHGDNGPNLSIWYLRLIVKTVTALRFNIGWRPGMETAILGHALSEYQMIGFMTSKCQIQIAFFVIGNTGMTHKTLITKHPTHPTFPMMLKGGPKIIQKGKVAWCMNLPSLQGPEEFRCINLTLHAKKTIFMAQTVTSK